MILQTLVSILIVFGIFHQTCSVNTTKVGVILPKTSAKHFNAIHLLRSRLLKRNSSEFLNVWDNITFQPVHWPISPTLKDVLDTFCETFLHNNVSVIIFITQSRFDDQNTAAVRYFMQLSNYIGIPVISWNTNSDSLAKSLRESVIVQVAPTVANQAQAIFALLKKYKRQKCCVLTTSIAGNEEFLRTLNYEVRNSLRKSSDAVEMLAKIPLRVSDDEEVMIGRLSSLKSTFSKCRIFVLHASKREAKKMFPAAEKVGLTGSEYQWIVTQSAYSSIKEPQFHFPVGLLGIYYNTSREMLNACAQTIRVLEVGLKNYYFKGADVKQLKSNVNCHQDSFKRWVHGIKLYKHFINVPLFSEATFEIFHINSQHEWRKAGNWTGKKLLMSNTTWPTVSASIRSTEQVKKTRYRVSFLEDPPFIIMKNHKAKGCKPSEVICRVPFVNISLDSSVVPSSDARRCCSGFFVDLLSRLSSSLDFDYDLKRVDDGKWGEPINGVWNGLISELLNNKTDMVLSSLIINSKRQEVVDFSHQILNTGISIVVAKKTGFVPPHAFLQPFDTLTWFIIVFVSIQMGTLLIFVFEWISPDGLNMKKILTKDHNFTLTQTYWLTLTMLFKAPLRTLAPKGWSSRMMVTSWAAFALVFLAIYTAKLADFMITRERYFDFKGVRDERLSKPLSQNPPFKFGTVPNGNTETIIRNNLPQMFQHMKQFNRVNVSEGIKAVKSEELDAFLYDGVVLDYLAGKEKDCRLITVGYRYAQSGYGIAFPKKFKLRQQINDMINNFKESELFTKWENRWVGEPCRPKHGYSNLSFKQFISAFVLLGFGIILCIFILLLEHCYSRYTAKLNLKEKSKKNIDSWWNLVTQSVSATKRKAEFDEIEFPKSKRNSEIWKLKRELIMTKIRADIAEAKIEQMQSKNKFKSESSANTTQS